MNPFIWEKHNSLTPEFCEHLIKKFDTDDRSGPGLIGKLKKVDSTIKLSLDLGISHLDDWKEEDNILYKSLNESIDEYKSHLENQFPNVIIDLYGSTAINDSGYQIQRTKPGEYYTWHNDHQVDDNIYVRSLTFIWYLNTITEDGYTEFYDGTKIQPEQGKLIIFPATWTFAHRGYPPKSETKYICTGWVRYELVR